MKSRKVHVYDTTLRDGAQAEDISFSLEDKLRIASRLDEFGVDYIEGGWPGANPKDAAFFREARGLSLKHAKLTAFGSTRRAKKQAEDDDNLKTLVAAKTPVVTLFGKSWELHVRDALRVSLDQNLEMIEDSVTFLKKNVPEVLYDAEHFFDGYLHNGEYALETLKAAVRGGADCIVLCDTNGGVLTHDVVKVIREVQKALPKVPLGIHVHNDSEMAVANTVAAVGRGVRHIQGTVNGYGERCGNANLCSIIPSLQLKMGLACVPEEKLPLLTDLSRFVSELANMPPWKHQPYVGDSAFAHKGGVHVSAIRRNPLTYEHITPESVGNRQRVLVSDLSGRANIIQKAKEFGIDLKAKDPQTLKILDHLKEFESRGYQYEGAEASFEL